MSKSGVSNLTYKINYPLTGKATAYGDKEHVLRQQRSTYDTGMSCSSDMCHHFFEWLTAMTSVRNACRLPLSRSRFINCSTIFLDLQHKGHYISFASSSWGWVVKLVHMMAQTGTHDGTQTGTHDGTQTGTHDGTQLVHMMAHKLVHMMAHKLVHMMAHKLVHMMAHKLVHNWYT